MEEKFILAHGRVCGGFLLFIVCLGYPFLSLLPKFYYNYVSDRSCNHQITQFCFILKSYLMVSVFEQTNLIHLHLLKSLPKYLKFFLSFYLEFIGFFFPFSCLTLKDQFYIPSFSSLLFTSYRSDFILNAITPKMLRYMLNHNFFQEYRK